MAISYRTAKFKSANILAILMKCMLLDDLYPLLVAIVTILYLSSNSLPNYFHVLQTTCINNVRTYPPCRLVQQALLERKQFEDQQRQLAAMHLRQQQELQKKQQVLRQMQEAQVATLQRQQLLLYQQSLQQQQRVRP